MKLAIHTDFNTKLYFRMSWQHELATWVVLGHCGRMWAGMSLRIESTRTNTNTSSCLFFGSISNLTDCTSDNLSVYMFNSCVVRLHEQQSLQLRQKVHHDVDA